MKWYEANVESTTSLGKLRANNLIALHVEEHNETSFI